MSCDVSYGCSHCYDPEGISCNPGQRETITRLEDFFKQSFRKRFFLDSLRATYYSLVFKEDKNPSEKLLRNATRFGGYLMKKYKLH